MIVEVTNRIIECAKEYYVQKIDETRYCGYRHFRLLLKSGGWTKEFSEPDYTYRIIKETD